MLLLQLLVLAVLLCVVIAGLVYLWSLMFMAAPFVPVPRAAVGRIIEALHLAPGAVLYDLGCGDARVLIAALRAEPQARCVGIDAALAAITVARLSRRRARLGEALVLQHQNFFTADLSGATHIFCFLFPGVMAKLEGKFARELKPGARVVCCDFKLPHREPSEVLRIGAPRALGSTLYIYEY